MSSSPHSKITIGFEDKVVKLPLDSILPIRQIKGHDYGFGKYKAIIASIQAIGIVEPLVVYPNKGVKNTWLLLDGHMRLHALKELHHHAAPCLVSCQDDAYTYNDKINRISIIQEHRMITKALASGVTEEEIAKALSIDVTKIVKGKGLLAGLHAETIQILKDKPISERALKILKRVCAYRQIEMANLMVDANNYTFSYAHALLTGTPQDQLAKPAKARKIKGLSAEEMSRIQKESENVSHEFRMFKEAYGENTLQLTTIRRYVRKLIENLKIKRFLEQRHPELYEELSELAALDSL